jgi:hypothetical protein
MRSLQGTPIIIFGIASLFGIPRLLLAHDLERTRVSIAFSSDASFVLDVSNDPNWLFLRLEPFAGNHGQLTNDPAQRDARLSELGSVFVDRIALFVDHYEVHPSSVEFLPPLPLAEKDDSVPLATYRLRGRLPVDSRSLRFFYGLVVDPYPLSVRRADSSAMTIWIGGNDWSAPLNLAGQFQVPWQWQTASRYLLFSAIILFGPILRVCELIRRKRRPAFLVPIL